MVNIRLNTFQAAYNKNNNVVSSTSRDLWQSISKQLLKAYKNKELKRKDLNDSGLDDKLLASGTEAFVLWSADNNSLAKIRYRPERDEKTRKEVEALAVVKKEGLTRVPDLLAYNGSNILVKSFCKGDPLGSLKPSVIKQISAEQLKDLFRTLDRLIALNCHIDESEGTFLYDAQQGFTVIDFSLENKPTDSKRVFDIVRGIFQELGIVKLFDSTLKAYQTTYVESGSLPRLPACAGTKPRSTNFGAAYGPKDLNAVIKQLYDAKLWQLAKKVKGVQEDGEPTNQTFKLEKRGDIYLTGGRKLVSARADSAKEGLRVISISGYSTDFLKNIFHPAWELDLMHSGFRIEKNLPQLEEYFAKIKQDIVKIFTGTGLDQGDRVITLGKSSSHGNRSDNYLELSHLAHKDDSKIARVKGFPSRQPMTVDYKALAGGGCEISYSKTSRADSYPKLVYRELNANESEIVYYSAKDAQPQILGKESE